MFAFAGASTFPTIQADMRQREKFSISAIMACISEKKFHSYKNCLKIVLENG